MRQLKFHVFIIIIVAAFSEGFSRVPCIFIDIAAHELGHLAHKDTDLILLMEVVEKDYGQI
ncbi:hypothetical protein DV092_08660 [Clostridium botulinum]|nr:hypothetical protein [Clostridium botulinum]